MPPALKAVTPLRVKPTGAVIAIWSMPVSKIATIISGFPVVICHRLDTSILFNAHWLPVFSSFGLGEIKLSGWLVGVD